MKKWKLSVSYGGGSKIAVDFFISSERAVEEKQQNEKYDKENKFLNSKYVIDVVDVPESVQELILDLKAVLYEVEDKQDRYIDYLALGDHLRKIIAKLP